MHNQHIITITFFHHITPRANIGNLTPKSQYLKSQPKMENSTQKIIFLLAFSRENHLTLQIPDQGV
jgi:hypothetical protein